MGTIYEIAIYMDRVKKMYYWYFKLFNNIKSEHEAKDLARLELESLFGDVEPIHNFADKLREEPLCKFINSSTRLQDFITHELPYGKIHGYFGVYSYKKDVNKLVRRLAYTREIYLIVNSNEPPESFAKEIFSTGVFRKNFHYFKVEDFICFRFITNQYFLEKSEYISKLSRNEKEVERNVEILFSRLMDDIYRIPASSTLSIGKRNENRLQNTLSGIRERKIKPDKVKSLLKECDKEWMIPKTSRHAVRQKALKIR